METYYIDKPHIDVGEFKLNDNTYNDKPITVVTSRYQTALLFNDVIKNYEEKGSTKLFIYEYTWKVDEIYHPDGNYSANSLWVRFKCY